MSEAIDGLFKAVIALCLMCLVAIGGCTYFAWRTPPAAPQFGPPLEYTEGPKPLTVEEFDQLQTDLRKKLDAGEWRVEKEWKDYPAKRYRWHTADGTPTKWVMESTTIPEHPPRYYPQVDPLPPGTRDNL